MNNERELTWKKDADVRSVERRIDRLREAQVFSSLSEAGLRRLAEVADVRIVRRGERVAYRAQNVGSVLFVWQGAIDIASSGSDASLAAVGRGESLGLVHVLTDARHEVEYEAVKASTLLVIPAEVIRELVAAQPAMMVAMVQLMAERIHVMNRELAVLRTQDPASRIVHTLGRLVPPGETVSITHAALASRIGTRRETVTRVLRKLVADGVVEQARGHLRLLPSAA